MAAFAFPLTSPFGGSGFSFSPSPPGPGGTPLSALGAIPAGELAGQLDQLIDPALLDYVRTGDGEWAETADSRTIMMLMLELELGASAFDPQDGTTIKAKLRTGDPVTPEEVRSEVLRAGRLLQLDGVLTDLDVQIRDRDGNALVDQAGRSLVVLTWRDLASGSPVDLVFQPR
jgi:hypothetical protein